MERAASALPLPQPHPDRPGAPETMEDIIADDQRRRLALLCEIYRVAEGNTRKGLGPSTLQDCARRAGLTGPGGDSALHWLVANELVEQTLVRETIFITHAGVKEVEASFSRPDTDTAHFSAAVIQSTPSRRP